MPSWIKGIGVSGNGLVAFIFVPLTLKALSNGQGVVAFFFLLLATLAVFNAYVINRAARQTSEEEYLKGEVRKAELRKELVELGKYATGDAPTAPPAQMQPRPTSGQQPTSV